MQRASMLPEARPSHPYKDRTTHAAPAMMSGSIRIGPTKRDDLLPRASKRPISKRLGMTTCGLELIDTAPEFATARVAHARDNGKGYMLASQGRPSTPPRQLERDRCAL